MTGVIRVHPFNPKCSSRYVVYCDLSTRHIDEAQLGGGGVASKVQKLRYSLRKPLNP